MSGKATAYCVLRGVDYNYIGFCYKYKYIALVYKYWYNALGVFTMVSYKQNNYIIL